MIGLIKGLTSHTNNSVLYISRKQASQTNIWQKEKYMEQANSVKEYLKIIKKYDDYPEKYFRGQLEKYTTIPPSIARDNGYTSSESAIYNDCINMGLTNFEGLDMPLERLAKMQHYGVPTRLVDVTIDPLVALFFAVENTKDTSPGVVYLYLHCGLAPDSITAKVLSVLPTLDNLSVLNIRETVQKIFHETISDDDVVAIASNPAIIKYSVALQKSNPRLYHQKGTFLICGNEFLNGAFSKTLRSLDVFTPCAIIRVPYEYKQTVKDELDYKYKISSPILFPELPSVADYIKEKYREKEFSPKGKYHIIKVKDISHGFVKRKSIIIVLNQPLQIEEIQQVAIDAMEQYKQKNHVVWVYIANTGDDYILSNWILRGQWIDSSLDKRFQPIPLKIEDKGYFWDFAKSFSIVADYNSTYVFESDNFLYIYHEQIWQQFVPIYREIESAYLSGEWSSLKAITNTEKKHITNLFMQLQDLGRSRNKEFDEYLGLFSQCIGEADDIRFWVERSSFPDQSIIFQIRKLIDRINTLVDNINNGLLQWNETLSIKRQDYTASQICNHVKPRYSYKATLPVSKTALIVQLNITPTVLPNKTIQVSGETNLFDGAELMLTLNASTGIICSGKSIIDNGRFIFPVCSNHGKGFAPGIINGTISLSLPSTQPKKFTELAGIEYENLTGDFISRNGIGPTGIYEFSLTIE